MPDIDHGRFPFHGGGFPTLEISIGCTLRDNLEEKITVVAIGTRDYLSLLGVTISDSGHSNNNKVSRMQIASQDAFRWASEVNVQSSLTKENDTQDANEDKYQPKNC